MMPLATVASLASNAAHSQVNKMKASASFALAIGICTFIASCFVTVALTVILAESVGIVVACLIMAGVFIVLALGCHVMRMIRVRRQERKVEANASALTAALVPAMSGGGKLGVPIAAMIAAYTLAKKG